MSAPGLADIARLYFRIGNTTFGSGNATIVLLRREIMERQWLAEWQLDLFYTLARVVPGTNVLAFVAASAYAMRGWAGVVAAVVALCVPASGVIVALTLGYQRWHDHPVGGAVIVTAMSSIVGIIVGAAWLMAWPAFRPGQRVRTLVLVLGGLALSFVMSPLSILAVAAVAGWFWPAEDRE